MPSAYDVPKVRDPSDEDGPAKLHKVESGSHLRWQGSDKLPELASMCLRTRTQIYSCAAIGLLKPLLKSLRAENEGQAGAGRG